MGTLPIQVNYDGLRPSHQRIVRVVTRAIILHSLPGNYEGETEYWLPYMHPDPLCKDRVSAGIEQMVQKTDLGDFLKYLKEHKVVDGNISGNKSEMSDKLFNEYSLWGELCTQSIDSHIYKRNGYDIEMIIEDSFEETRNRITGEVVSAMPVTSQKSSDPSKPELSSRDMFNQLVSSVVRQEMTKVMEEHKKPNIIEVAQPAPARPINIGLAHSRFEDLLTVAGAGLNSYLAGPSGGGKSRAAAMIAKALNLEYLPLSMGPQTPQSQLFGYHSATGNYVSTPLRQAVEGTDVYFAGALLLLDEMDRCNESILVTLNNILASGPGDPVTFPDGTVAVQDNLVVIGTGNTMGHGADAMYVSARQQDLSVLSRFVTIPWGLDENLESAILGDCEKAEWITESMKAIRAYAKEHGLRYDLGMRKSLQALDLANGGGSKVLIREAVMLAGWSPVDKRKGLAILDLI
jgi:hypothetical protein